jgi:hypothetical protein
MKKTVNDFDVSEEKNERKTEERGYLVISPNFIWDKESHI